MEARLRILLLEDDVRDAELIEAYLAPLSTPGAPHHITRVDTRQSFEHALAEGSPDLILSDYSLPAFDGMSALRLAHAARPDVPFIFVSGAIGEETAIESLKCGATDYVLKQRLERLPSSVSRALRESANRIERKRRERQTARLYAMTGALSRALTPAEVARVVIDEGMSTLGADSGMVTLIRAERGDMEVLHYGGVLHKQFLSGASFVPLTASIPSADVARTVKSTWMPSRLASSDQFPAYAANLEAHGVHSWCAWPLVFEERVIGTFSLWWTAERADLDGERELLYAMSQQLAQALERARLFEERGRLYDQAQKALKCRDDVLAVVSHDLRNPLSNVLMIARMLLDVEPVDELSRSVVKQAGMLDRSARRMERLIRDLMDFASIETGHLGVEPKPVSRKALLREVGEAMELLASQKRIQLVIAGSDGDREFVCDRGRLIQVFGNLIGNAVKFTPEGGTVTVRTLDAVESAVAFEVRDTGPGIPKEQLPRIFEPYWQGQSTSSGIGLGLAITRGILEAHGGRIWVESTVGEGTAFCFSLPVLEMKKRRKKVMSGVGH